MGFITYVARSVPIFTMTEKISESVKKLLYFVPPAVFASLVASTINQDVDHRPERLIALVAASVAAIKTRNILVTVITGMSTFLLLSLKIYI